MPCGILVKWHLLHKESHGCSTISTPACHAWGSCGYQIAGLEVKVFKVDHADINKKTQCPAAPSLDTTDELFQGHPESSLLSSGVFPSRLSFFNACGSNANMVSSLWNVAVSVLSADFLSLASLDMRSASCTLSCNHLAGEICFRGRTIMTLAGKSKLEGPKKRQSITSINPSMAGRAHCGVYLCQGNMFQPRQSLFKSFEDFEVMSSHVNSCDFMSDFMRSRIRIAARSWGWDTWPSQTLAQLTSRRSKRRRQKPSMPRAGCIRETKAWRDCGLINMATWRLVKSCDISDREGLKWMNIYW